MDDYIIDTFGEDFISSAKMFLDSGDLATYCEYSRIVESQLERDNLQDKYNTDEFYGLVKNYKL